VPLELEYEECTMIMHFWRVHGYKEGLERGQNVEVIWDDGKIYPVIFMVSSVVCIIGTNGCFE